uniref:Uncharacterized protein n=1 Tax=Arundo donax TaxID=35708 RepID=A0A0A9FLQ7_ARUDO
MRELARGYGGKRRMRAGRRLQSVRRRAAGARGGMLWCSRRREGSAHAAAGSRHEHAAAGCVVHFTTSRC